MRDGRGGPMVWQIGPAVCRHELMLGNQEARRWDDAGETVRQRHHGCRAKRCAGRRRWRFGDRRGPAWWTGPQDQQRGQAAGEEVSSAPSWQSVS